MELILSPEEEKFRDEVREFVSTEVSEEIRRKTKTGFRRIKKITKVGKESFIPKDGWLQDGP